MDPKPAIKRCQSCGMPWNETLVGTESGGAPSPDYCSYCYAEGRFLEPDLNIDGMIRKSIKFMMRDINVSEERAEVMANATIPGLKRWNKAGKPVGPQA